MMNSKRSQKPTEINNLFNVKDKIVVITGGARGIGLMIAQGFIDNGAKVILASRRSETLEKAVNFLSQRGPGTCYAFTADISREEDCKSLAERIASRENHIDVLLNNAGASWGAPLESYPSSGWDKVMATNVKSIFYLTRYCLPLLEKTYELFRTPARVINIGSIDGIRVPSYDAFAYFASKAAVHQLTRVLAYQFMDKKITVNAVAAGPFETKMMAGILKTFGDVIQSSTLFQRIGEVEDIVGVCIYLSSKAAEWVTGVVIPIDGGILIKPSL